MYLENQFKTQISTTDKITTWICINNELLLKFK